MNSGTENPTATVFLLPVYNDWDSVPILLKNLDEVLRRHPWISATVVLVDDGSTQVPSPELLRTRYDAIPRLELLRLRGNLGNQRALAVGLAYAYDQLQPEAVVPMDSDGEDRPEDAPLLLQRMKDKGGRSIVFAERRRRTNSASFKFFYFLYRSFHRLLTGFWLNIGNFSAVPRESLGRLMAVSDLWNHYAASVIKARLARETLPADRGRRISGETKMNFVSYALHGLRAVSVYSELIGVRLLLINLTVISLVVAGLAGAACVRRFSGLASPLWTMYAAGLLTLILFQFAMINLVVVFFFLFSCANLTFIPLRDYKHFIAGVERR